MAFGVLAGVTSAGADSSAFHPREGDEYFESGDDLDLDMLLLEDELALLYAEDMVVSASRRSQRISESPATITVIHRDDILAAGYRDVAEIMRTVPGGMVYRFNPMSVGVGIRAGTTSMANRVLVLVDGRDQGLHLSGQPTWNSLPIDLESIERIEVIRGPGSSIYGANALQGVVNIITRQPGSEPWTAETNLSAAGTETYAGDLRIHGSEGRFRWWGNAGYDQEAFFQRPEEVGYISRRARGWVGFDLTDALEGRLEAGYSDAEGWFVAPAGDAECKWSMGYASARLRAPDSELQLSLEAGNGHFDPNSKIVAPPLSAGQEPLHLGTLEPTELSSVSADLIAWHSMALGESHRFMFGLSGRLIRHGEGTLLVCPEGVLPAEFDIAACEGLPLNELRGGLFLQDEWAVTDQLLLTAGARLDTNSLHPEAGMSPRLALVWAPAENHSLRASLGRAYRKPSYIEAYNSMRVVLEEGVPSDLGARLQHLFAMSMPNNDLRNEKMTAIELGWSTRLRGGRFSTAVDLFGMRIDGRIWSKADVNLQPGFGGVPTLNDDARMSFLNHPVPGWGFGGELSAEARLTHWFRLRGHYGYQKLLLYEEQDDQIVRMGELWNPEHRLHLAARVNHPSGLRAGLDAHAYSHYRRHIQDPDSILLPVIEQAMGETMLVGAALSYALNLRYAEIEVGLRGSNLLGLSIRELPGVEKLDRTYGGEELASRFRLFVRGEF